MRLSLSRSRRSRRIAVAATTAVAAFVLASCGSGGAGDSAAAGPATDGGNLVYLASFDNPNLQWTAANDWEPSILIASIADRLVYWDSKSSELEPWLATAWTNNADSSRYELTIRQGVTFSDGTPLDAKAVADNLTIKGKGDTSRGIPALNTWPPGFQSAEVIAPDKVAVTFSQPAYGFIRALTFYHSAIVGEKTLGLNFEDSSNIKNIVGTGPFTFDSYTPGEQYVLKKRPDYNWAPDGVDHQGAAHVDTVTVKIAADPSIRTGLLSSGQGNVMRDVPPADEKRLTGSGFTVFPAKQIAYSTQIRIRANSAATADVKVRQAIQHAINRKEIVDTLYFSDLWKPATGALEQGVPGSVDQSAKLGFDQQQANTLLDQAGWTARDAEGFRVKDGQRLTLPIYAVYWIRNAEPELLLVAQQLKAVGIDLQVKTVDKNNETATVGAAGVSMQIFLGSLPTVSGPMWNVFNSTVATSWFNGGGAHAPDTELDQALTALKASPDEASFTKNVAVVQDQLVDKGYVVPLETNQLTFATDNRVHDMNVDAYGRLFFYDAWLSK